jgi:hypothetical protein
MRRSPPNAPDARARSPSAPPDRPRLVGLASLSNLKKDDVAFPDFNAKEPNAGATLLDFYLRLARAEHFRVRQP